MPTLQNGQIRSNNSSVIDDELFECHCIKSIRIRIYSGLHFFRIFPYSDWIRRDTEYLSVFSPNAGKMQTRITPNTNTFYAVCVWPKETIQRALRKEFTITVTGKRLLGFMKQVKFRNYFNFYVYMHLKGYFLLLLLPGRSTLIFAYNSIDFCILFNKNKTAFFNTRKYKERYIFMSPTAWKEYVFGVFLVSIFQNTFS